MHDLNKMMNKNNWTRSEALGNALGALCVLILAIVIYYLLSHAFAVWLLVYIVLVNLGWANFLIERINSR